MCGRFAQSQTREEYLAYLAKEAERNIAYDPEPIGRYNVAPGTQVLILSERNEQLCKYPDKADHFTWHPVSRTVGNVKNQGPELIEMVK
ncbi:hypothetical protein DJ520_07610 [Klebsiella quasipneumoniae]|nr:hypothetical protein DJ520_07610 [Klebsiella quasipneumoniae]VVJ45832.1 Uncharacterised protein [Klebsiella quasipneumoniae]HCB1266943.1 hypothetical protein [Klebsiella quasipneumoniae subsp. quasipneumoniae]